MINVKLDAPGRPQLAVTISAEMSSRVIGLCGSSGSGKSSLLNTLAGLESNAQVKNTLFDSASHRLGYVTQGQSLFTHLSVRENLSLAAKFAAPGAPGMKLIINGCECDELLDRPVSGLSGGEMQRLCIARALINGAQILLLDESFSAMDAARQRRLLRFILELEHIRQILWVSHDMSLLVACSDYIVELQGGERIFEGSTDDFVQARYTKMAGNNERVNVFSGEPDGMQGQSVRLRWQGQILYAPASTCTANFVRWYVPGSQVLLDNAVENPGSWENAIAGTVKAISPAESGRHLVSVDCDGAVVFSSVTDMALQRMQLRQGSRVTARFASQIQITLE